MMSFPEKLRELKESVYDRCGFRLSDYKAHSEGVGYGACSFVLNGRKIEHRVSKITPTKTGQFVTTWKRNHLGITVPFDVTDDLGFIVITCGTSGSLGQFIFPKSVLVKEGILSVEGKGGKRGIRVYSPWDAVANRQAIKTKDWQSRYFITVKGDTPTDLEKVTKLIQSV